MRVISKEKIIKIIIQYSLDDETDKMLAFHYLDKTYGENWSIQKVGTDFHGGRMHGSLVVEIKE